MYRKVFIDASSWISFILKDQIDHPKAYQLMHQLLSQSTALFTSNDVIDETMTRLMYLAGFSISKRFWQLFQENINRQLLTQLWVDEQLQVEAWTILSKFREHRLSLTDATSIALINRFNLDAIFTFDSDFAKVGLTVLP